MAKCSKCGSEADASVKFCPSCGSKFIPVAPAVNAGEDGLYYCAKHKKTTTRVTCEKPICDRCMVVGANGVRCLDCARNKIPMRLSGVVHDAGRSVSGAARGLGGRPVWYLYIWTMIIRVIMSFFGRF
jgi:hypothetical protein